MITAGGRAGAAGIITGGMAEVDAAIVGLLALGSDSISEIHEFNFQ
jgi:hypothetical protein